MPQQTSPDRTETWSPKGAGGQWRSWLHWVETISNVILQPYKNEMGRTVQILHEQRVLEQRVLEGHEAHSEAFHARRRRECHLKSMCRRC